MSLIAAALLGIVEGITEFLPVSSTGHLLLAQALFNIPVTDAVKSFNIVIQLGAIAAALIVYWKTLISSRKTLILVLAAFIPTALLGAALHHVVKEFLLDPSVVVWSLFLGGIVMIAFELLHDERKATAISIGQISIRQAVAIGMIQTLAIIPGTSRSAATIVGGMMLGVRRNIIVDFSFLLAIPTMAGATVLDLSKSAGALSAHDSLTIIVGFLTSFLAAYVAIRWLLSYVRSHTFLAFGIYRIIIAICFWAFVLKKP